MATTGLAVAAAALAPPAVMIGLWEILAAGEPAGEPLRDVMERVGRFVAAEAPFFFVVALIGAAVDRWIGALRFRFVLDLLAFAAIGAAAHLILTGVQLIGTSPSNATILTIARLAVMWWAPFSAVGGLFFWAVTTAGRSRRGP